MNNKDEKLLYDINNVVNYCIDWELMIHIVERKFYTIEEFDKIKHLLYWEWVSIINVSEFFIMKYHNMIDFDIVAIYNKSFKIEKCNSKFKLLYGKYFK